MSRSALQVIAACGFATVAVAIAWRFGLGLARPLAIAAVRAIVQLAVVGALIAAVFSVPALGAAFTATMVTTAALTSGSRLRAVPQARRRAALAIGLPAILATGILLAVGAFAFTPRAAVPTAGILTGGAMAATSLAGRALLEGLRSGYDEVEARLALGDAARAAVAPVVRSAVTTGLVPVIDQTRSVGLVTLPGTFVGLVLGGASALTAATTQLVVLLALLAVELTAALVICELMLRATIASGERIVVPR